MGRIQTTAATRGKATGRGAQGVATRIGTRRLDFESFTKEQRRLCYDTSRWQHYLYASRASATEASEKAIQAPLREDAQLKDARQTDVADMAGAIGRELFGRLYGDPAPLDAKDKRAPGWMDRVHSTLDEMPEWDQLRKQVGGDPDFSALATHSMLTSLTGRLGELIKQVQEEEAAADQPEDPDAPKRKPLISGSDALRAELRAACASASADAAEGKEALNGIAAGLDGTPPSEMQKDTERLDLLLAVQRDPDFAEIIRRAGRLKRVSGRSELRRSRDTYEEVVDIEIGGDLARLLPSEIMGLLDPDLEILTLSKIADGRALQYRLEGHEPMGRGPLVYLRDVSGSMCGDGHLWGGAVAVALTAQALKERRPLLSACFNHDVHYMRKLDVTGLYSLDKSAQVSGTLATGRMAGAHAALAHVRDGVSGGTCFTEPLRFAMAAGITEPRADFIFCTDGQADADPATLEKLIAAKATGLRVFGFTVNGGSVSGPLRAICDEILDIDQDDYQDEASLSRKLGGMIRSMR